MTLDLERRLEALDAQPRPAAVRLDSGPADFGGRGAVLPSAYNPPTEAHLRMLRLAAGTTTVPAALLTTRNVDKGLTGASLAQRVEMLLAAREELPGLAVLVTNAARFVDQAAALRRLLPRAELVFVAGYDTLVRLFAPGYYTDMHADLRDFFTHHRLIATNRAEAGIESVEAFLDTPDAAPYRDRIEVRQLDEHAASLSSTLAREHAAAGRDHPALPPAVARYIRAHGLYRPA